MCYCLGCQLDPVTTVTPCPGEFLLDPCTHHVPESNVTAFVILNKRHVHRKDTYTALQPGAPHH